MDQDKINAFNEERQRQAEIARDKAERQAQTDAVVGAVKSSNKVQVTNDIATSKDIDSVIKQLKEVQVAALLGSNKSSVVLADSTDLGEAVAGLGSKLDALAKSLEAEKSDKELIKTVKEELTKVANILRADDDFDVVTALVDVRNAIESLDVQPVVNVPKVTIPKTDVKVDLSAVAKEVASLKTAFSKLKLPVTDLSSVNEGLDNVVSTIRGLSFPVPNFVQDPYIRYKTVDEDDDGVSTSIKYYGFIDPEGHWYILKVDPSGNPKTYRYAFGGVAYQTNWTNRASLSYDLPFVAGT